jgi:hypothetical protein
MPDEKKLDAFKPQQPKIPGVPLTLKRESATPLEKASAGPPGPQGNAATAIWIAIAVVGAFIIAGALFYRALRPSTKAVAFTGDASDVVSAPAVAHAPPAVSGLPVGPGVVATEGELAKPWSAKRFLFHGHVSVDPEPAIVVRLPGGQYWGFSLREPFGSCELEYVTDLQRLQTDYHFRADHPMVGNPCTHTVYDLLRYSGSGPDGGLVRGEIVGGTGIRPPMAIEIRTEGRDVIAVRME